MSVLCPKCSHTVDADFGLATCPNCATVLNIDFDGNVNMGDVPSQLGITTEDPPHVEESINPYDNPSFDPMVEQPIETTEEIIAETTSEESNLELDPSVNENSAPDIEVPNNESLSRPDFADVIEFGNSNKQEGPLSYTLVLGNIDTADVRDKVVEALSDKSLQIDLAEVLENARMGEYVIPNLGPAKTSRLVKKLLSLPISIQWRQNAY